MKTQVVQLEFSDNLPALTERIIQSETVRVILVDQRANPLLRDEVTLRKLFRSVTQAGKQLCIVSDQEEVRQICEELNQPVFDQIGQVENEEWQPSVYEGFSIKPKETIWISQRPGGLRSGIKDRKSVIRYIAFGLSILAVLTLLFILIPSSRILITPQPIIRVVNLPINVVSGNTDSSSLSTLSGEVVEIPIQLVKTVSIKSMNTVSVKRASGRLDLVNLTNSAVIYPVGQTFRAQTDTHLEYAALQEIRLEGKVGATASVPVEAVNAGTASNLPAETIFDVLSVQQGIVSVKNPTEITGGSEEQRAVASTIDRNDLRNEVLKAAESQAEARFSISQQNQRLIIPKSLILNKVESEVYFPPVGTAGEQLSLDMNVIYQGLSIDQIQANEVAQRIIQQSLQPNQLIEQIRTERVDLLKQNLEGNAEIQLQVIVVIEDTLDESAILNQIMGKSVKEAERLLSGSKEYAAIQIIQSPAWWPWIPSYPWNISIERD